MKDMGQPRLVLLCMVVLVSLPTSVHTAIYDNYKTLATNLFNGYRKELRPLEDSNRPVDIFFGMWLRSIQELDEINQELTFASWFEIDWVDPNLSWNPQLYNNTQYFTYPQEYIWIPDITIMNSVESMKELGFNRNYLYLSYVGHVKWIVGGVFHTSCDIDVTYYPFDTQVCHVIITTLVSSKMELDLSISSTHSVSLDWYSESGSWSLQSVDVGYVGDTTMVCQNIGKPFALHHISQALQRRVIPPLMPQSRRLIPTRWRGSEVHEIVHMPSTFTSMKLLHFECDRTRVAFSITMKRLRLYYIVTIIIPIIFLSLTATLVFALPADSGEKMGTSITVLLAFAVYLTIVAEQMPKTSTQASLMAVYLTLLLGQTALGVLLSVWILNIHFRDDARPPSRRLCKVVSVLQILIRKGPKKTAVAPFDQSAKGLVAEDKKNNYTPRDTTPTPPASEEPEMTWQHVAYILDRTLFYSFSILLVLLTIIFMTMLVVGGNNQ